MFGVQLYKNNARTLLSRILSILNLDWLQHAGSVRGVYELNLFGINGPTWWKLPNIYHVITLKCLMAIHRNKLFGSLWDDFKNLPTASFAWFCHFCAMATSFELEEMVSPFNCVELVIGFYSPLNQEVQPHSPSSLKILAMILYFKFHFFPLLLIFL